MRDLKEEIFEEFFKKLKEEKVPNCIIEDIKELQESGDIISKNKMLEILEKGHNNVNED